MAEEWSEDRIRGIVRDELAAAEAEASLMIATEQALYKAVFDQFLADSDLPDDVRAQLSKFVDDLLG
ncbi:hypothetical protein [Mycobacteroides abscessus]|uniref:hypothetical protein n=1 Tax=Mycobacteroides abscessus TaxID=36809 RepID=UPI0002D706C6|nr:hypothetical protein [Mycobacteroides abscessus]PVB19747.1 hypothetical protein DDJ40_08295 [Mycobacteroides abscessus]RIU40349.1 hypothetical protein D2E83_11305 [Mycobacteroides abscessus]